MSGSATTTDRELLSVDGYLIDGLVGRGGMGAVYRATQLSLGQPVAIKVLGEAFRGRANFVERFQREANLQATLQHPNVVPVLASGDADGVPYIVMRLISGPSLRELVRVAAPDPIAGVELLTGIAGALDFAHARGILHLDVKPHNVLIEGGRHAWLADFGLTRMLEESTGLTMSSGLVGTFDYLAPEIARGERASSASDIYSLAATLFQVLTGSLPFPVAHQAAALFAHAGAPRPRASELNAQLPAPLDAVLQRGMAIDAAARQASAGALLDDAREALGLAPLGERLWADAITTAYREPQPAAAGGFPSDEVVQDQAPSWAPTAAPAAPGATPRRARAARAIRRPRAIRRSRAAALLAGTASLLAAVIVAASLLLGGGGHALRRAAPRLTGRTYPETVGGETHTWVNYKLAEGREGSLIAAYRTVQIACRVRGYKVQDGNVWWYRIASKPWDGRYYASADAFYNNGRTHGSLIGSAFVDPRVPSC